MKRWLQLWLVVELAGAVAAWAAEPVRAEVLVRSDTMWDGTPLPDCDGQAVEVTVARITIAPHSRLPMHKHPMINAGYLVSGELTVYSAEGLTRKVTAGEGLIELVDKWHYGRNDSDDPAVIVVVYVGAKGQPLSVKEAPVGLEPAE